MPPPPDANVRDAALDITQSFIVQAPAGSGKTELLTQRFLALLGAVDQPETIVAITFTRKAAGEMRNRITRALERACGPEPAADREHEKKTWKLASAALRRNDSLGWSLLENPSRLCIMTIDALCLWLASHRPWTSGLGAAPSIADDSGELYQEAALRTLALVETSDESRPVVEGLLAHVDNSVARAAELIEDMLACRDQWLRHLSREPNRVELQASLQAIASRAIQEIRPLVPPEAWDLMRYASRTVEEFGVAGADELTRLKTLANFLLTKQGAPRKSVNKNVGFPPGDPRKEEMAGLCEILDEGFAEMLAEIRMLPPPEYSDDQWQLIDTLVRVLHVAVKQLNAAFKDRGAVDFVELTIRSTAAVRQAETHTGREESPEHLIQHLLLDEFQDTSRSKMGLMVQLVSGWKPGDGKTVFAVGDPMQSIYSFQEAEVSLFEQCRRNGLGPVRLDPLNLTTNFRSSRNLVQWVNQSFPDVLAPRDDIATGAVAYSPSEAFRDPLDGDPVLAHFVSVDEEAQRVADLVEQVPDGDTVAILVRRRRDAHEIAAELKRRGIQFQAVEMEPLERQSVVQDLRALTRALVHPGDRVSWLSILRAPWCGLKLADLLVVSKHRIILDALTERAGLTPDACARLDRVAPILENAYANRRRDSLRRHVEKTWRLLGGPSCLRDAAQQEYAGAFFDLLEEIESAGDLSALKTLDKELEKLSAAPDPDAPPRIQIMTMHKSKGLEFDTVILPGLSNSPRSPGTPMIRWNEADGLVIGTIKETGADRNPVYDYLQHIAKKREQNETGRLLYVACTRARKRLHLVGGEPKSNSMLQRLGAAVGADFTPTETAGEQRTPNQAEFAPPAAPPLLRVPASWRTPGPPLAIDWAVEETPIEPAEAITFDWSGQRARCVGIVVHRILQAVGREGLDAWPLDRVEQISTSVRSQLATLGVSTVELAESAEQVLFAVRSTLTSERGRWILEDHECAESEWKMTCLVDGALGSCIIDRTFVENGVRWIVDFKSGIHLGGRPDVFLDQEFSRYRPQLARYADAIGRFSEQQIVIGLYFPLLQGWRSEEL